MKKKYLTKRSDRLAELTSQLKWSNNIWMGVSIESQDYTYRIEHLKKVPASVRFLSIEPFINKIEKINLKGIDWVIVGGESGPKSRPMEKEWVELILEKCKKSKVPFFFKQWGGVNKKKNGRLLNGRLWSQMPIPKSRRLA